MLAETPKATGGEHGGRVRIDGARKVPSNPTPTLADIGITKKLPARSQKASFKPLEPIIIKLGGKAPDRTPLEPFGCVVG